jgi:hypothetical protein
MTKRHIIAILMLSPFYFTLPLRERCRMVARVLASCPA